VPGAGLTEIVTDVEASGEIPLDATTLNVYVPGVVGLPERTPRPLTVSPGGTFPVAE